MEKKFAEMEALAEAICRDGRLARLPFHRVCDILGLDRKALDRTLFSELGADGDELLWRLRD